MNDRYRNEGTRREGTWRDRDRPGESGFRDGSRQGGYADAAGPRYSSDEDETYGSEWERGQEPDYGSAGSRGYGGREPRRGLGGNVGQYGSGGRGGYSGGYAGGDYGGGTGTSYDRGNFDRGGGGSSASSQGLYSSQVFGRQGTGFGSGFGQGYRGRDVSGPGADLRSRGMSDGRAQRGGYAGRGPKGYSRTDERIREDVCERLSQDDDVDASEIEVSVKDGEVTLRGTVITRSMKHDAEDLAENVSGVSDVHNELRVLKGMLSELKDKISGDEQEQHFAGGGTKNDTTSATGMRSSS